MECLATVEVWIGYNKAWGLAIDPIWPRYDAALREATTHFDPAVYEQAKAAGQMIGEQLSERARIIFLS